MENLLRELGYVVRFEKGTFHSGFCILEEKKVIVINRYYSLESKINSIIDIISQLNPDPSLLEKKSQLFFYSIQQQKQAI
jgi:ArsR family metal-binding transcriptional regulator